MKTGHWLPLYETLRMFGMPAFGMLFGFGACFRHRMPADGGVLIVANHQSFLDPILINVPDSPLASRISRAAPELGPIIGSQLHRGVTGRTTWPEFLLRQHVHIIDLTAMQQHSN